MIILYLMICTPAVLFGAYILFSHKSASDKDSNLRYNYPYAMYLVLSIWWVVCTLYFVSPLHQYSAEARFLFAGETIGEILAMVVGYIIATILTYLGIKELQYNVGVFKTPTQEMYHEVKNEVFAKVKNQRVQEEILRLAQEEFSMQKEAMAKAKPASKSSEDIGIKDIIKPNPTLTELMNE